MGGVVVELGGGPPSERTNTPNPQSTTYPTHTHTHARARRHSQFEESTRKVPRLVCAACGKPCRSDVERALHTRHTGHEEFVDRVGGAFDRVGGGAFDRASLTGLLRPGARRLTGPCPAGRF
jgi:hypothetical protein